MLNRDGKVWGSLGTATNLIDVPGYSFLAHPPRRHRLSLISCGIKSGIMPKNTLRGVFYQEVDLPTKKMVGAVRFELTTF